MPDQPSFNEADRLRIEGEYLDRYMSRIKESHVRMNTLLWYLLSETKKAEISSQFPDEIETSELNLFGSENK